MNLVDIRGGKGVEVRSGIAAQVARAHINVVHVEQQPAAGTPYEFREKLDLAELVTFEAQVVTGIFDRDAPLQRVLDARNVGTDPIQRFSRARKRQQVRVIRAVPGRPGEMLRYERRLEALDEALEIREVRRVGPGIGRQRHRYAMQ